MLRRHGNNEFAPVNCDRGNLKTTVSRSNKGKTLSFAAAFPFACGGGGNGSWPDCCRCSCCCCSRSPCWIGWTSSASIAPRTARRWASGRDEATRATASTICTWQRVDDKSKQTQIPLYGRRKCIVPRCVRRNNATHATFGWCHFSHKYWERKEIYEATKPCGFLVRAIVVLLMS